MATKQKETAVVIGGGFAGLSSACALAKKGYRVILLDKNSTMGGRATIWQTKGFTFDMGPSWYWMPEIFDQFFEFFGKKTSDYCSLKRLDPAYKVFYEKEEILVPDKEEALYKLFEKREKGAASRLKSFLEQAKYKYDIGIGEFVWKPSLSITEFLDPRLILAGLKLNMTTSQRKHVMDYVKDPVLVSLLEWPVLFLGGSPQNVPALYSLMVYAPVAKGTFYPSGGMSAPALAMANLAKELGVELRNDVEVKKIKVNEASMATGVETNQGSFEADVVVAAADYHHVEQNLLEEKFRYYDEKYWDSRVLSPSSLLFFLGVDKKLKNLEHHNLFFDRDLDVHCAEIYSKPEWPSQPLFYVCVTTATDSQVAPEGMENVFVLIPLAPGLEDTEELREKCFNQVMERLEERVGEEIRSHVIVKRSFAHKDFEERYHSYKGNAYGLANTLLQTAFLKPSIKPGKVKNLYFSGHLTSPGPGVPPSMISGMVAARLVEEDKEKRARWRRGEKVEEGGFLKVLVLIFLIVGALLAYFSRA